MAEAVALGVAGSVTADAAGSAAVAVGEGHYSEGIVKERILSDLQQIKDDTKALRNDDFRTARDALTSWSNSRECMGSSSDLDHLKTAAECSRKSFDTVTDPLDKLAAVTFLIYAEYHRVALLCKDAPYWTRGKKNVQQLLRQYVDHKTTPQLFAAAKSELGGANFLTRMFGDNDRGRMMLRSYVNLSAAVYDLPPLRENVDHPRFSQLEEAVLHACGRSGALMVPARVGHILPGPQELGTFKGHTDGVVCCAVFADGMTRAISGSGDRTLKVWDLSTGEEMHTLQGHTDWVKCCAVFADGSRAISGSGDRTLKVWDLSTGEELHTLQGHTNTVRCCTVFADGTRAISGSNDNTLKLWDLSTGEEIHTFEGHTDSVLCCVAVADGTRAISGSWDNTLKVWDLSTGELIHTLQGNTESISGCAVFANDTRGISGSWDNTLKVWDLSAGKEIHTLQGHSGEVICCAVFADDTRVISGSYDNTLKVWDLSTGEEIHTLQGHTDLVICCAVFADDSRVISGSWDNTLKVWDLSTGEEIHTLQGHADNVSCCAVFANDTRAISGSDDNTLKVWEFPVTSHGVGRLGSV